MTRQLGNALAPEVALPQKRNTRPKNRRMIILERAATLFAQSGFEGTSISDIADAVGLSKPALYHHFADKNEIYASIVVTVLEQMYQGTEQAVETRSSAMDGVKRFMEAHARYIDLHYDSFIAAQLGFRGLREPPARRTAIYWRDRYENLLRSIVAEGIKQGEFLAVDIKTTTWAILSCLNWMARWYKPGGGKPAIYFGRQYCDLLLTGLLARSNDIPRNLKR